MEVQPHSVPTAQQANCSGNEDIHSINRIGVCCCQNQQEHSLSNASALSLLSRACGVQIPLVRFGRSLAEIKCETALYRLERR